jgi:alanyl-tRNA synthetase
MTDTIRDGTKKLYYEDAYATAFNAKVLSCTEKKSAKHQDPSVRLYDVILDQTLFFPEEGGQSPDQGVLDRIPVVDVQISGGVIRHTVAQPIEEGKEVGGVIEWEHRFSNMQQHSGEHIFSGLVHGKFGYDNVGFHLSDREVTMDFSGPIREDEIREIERRANEVIFSNIETQILYPTKEEEKEIAYRSKIEIEGQTRLVIFPGVDVCACCAPHVRRTGEIGILKAVGLQNYKGGVRVSILCGRRALQRFVSDQDILAKTSNYLTTSFESVYDSVVKLKEENARQKAALQKAAACEMKQMIEAVPADRKNVCLFTEGADAKAMRDAVNLLVQSHEGNCAFFSGNDESGYSYIIGCREGDARLAGKILTEKFGARGGGKPEMIQGSVKAAGEDLRAVIESI